MKIALTFDDGPGNCTTRILNILQRNEGHLSFFVMGGGVEEHKGKIYRMSQMGCDVLCHAWNHTDFTTLKKRAIKRQLLSTFEAIAGITGNVFPIFRPPYGYYDENVEKVARKLGLSMICWSLDSRDWECKDADTIYSNIMENAKDGDVVLCHDVYDSTVEAMSRVIPELIGRGFELVTVSQLLREKYGEFEPGRMYYDTEV